MRRLSSIKDPLTYAQVQADFDAGNSYNEMNSNMTQGGSNGDKVKYYFDTP
jgi:hypothetical protein